MADPEVRPLIAGKPVKIAIPCAGIEPGGPVTVKVFEPDGLGGDPIDTLQAKVAEDGGVAETTWTYDYKKYKDKAQGSAFVLLVEGAGRTTISERLEFLELFDAKIQDAQGNPAANRRVVLHQERGENIPAVTDETGRVKKLVPPGDFHVEIGEEVPPGERIPPFDPAEAAALAAAVAAAAAAAAAISTLEDSGRGGAATEDADPEAAKRAEEEALAAELASSPARTIPGAVFAFDSAFPGPGIFEHLQQVEDAARKFANARFVVFGHADSKGSEDYNKDLTDRRAKAVLALLTDDLPLFEKVSDHDKWGTKQYQAMLRGLGCNPGAIDGVEGPLLEEALKAFQAEYNEGIYHEGERKRAHPDLVVNGRLDAPTKAAIRDAYVVGTPGSVDASRFSGPRFAGCSEFNLLGQGDALDRRVVIALFGPDGPKDSEFPCKAGKAAACPVDSQKPTRCKFYRKVVKEEDRGPHRTFFDPQWLRRKDGKVELSALTTLPDDSPATFTVFKCENGVPSPPPESFRGDAKPVPGQVLGTVEGKILHGVCFAIWEPPPGFDPFDIDAWSPVHELDIHDPAAPFGSEAFIAKLEKLAGRQPPIYSIESGDQFAFSRPPGKRLNRMRFVTKAEVSGLHGRAQLPTEAWIEFDAKLVPGTKNRFKVAAKDDVDVVAVLLEEVRTEPEGEEQPADV